MDLGNQKINDDDADISQYLPPSNINKGGINKMMRGIGNDKNNSNEIMNLTEEYEKVKKRFCDEVDKEEIIEDLKPIRVFKKIKAIQFGIYSPAEIIKAGAVEVKHADVLEAGKIKKNGVLDLRLGPCENGPKCGTCGKDVKWCPGHFGYIRLKTPVANILFVNNIIDVLKCICFHCSRVLLNRSSPLWKKIEDIKRPVLRFQALKDAILKGKDGVKQSVKHRKCTFYNKAIQEDEGCGQLQPSYKQEDKLKIVVTFLNMLKDGKKSKRLSPKEITEIFRKIDLVDYKILAFDPDNTTPESLVMRALPVPPSCIRPTNKSSNIARKEDDMTQKLLSIEKDNLSLPQKQLNKSPNDFLKDLQAFQIEVGEYIDVDPLAKKMVVGTNPQKMAKTKGIVQKLGSKSGRIRGNILGKRVDQSARTVISPDDNLFMDQMGMPKYMASILTYPETVTPLNIIRLTESVIKGPDNSGGANAIEKTDGEKFQLGKRDMKRVLPLQFGWKVERHLMDGDVSIVNRQPSLHRVSIQAHSLRLLYGKTFRLNLSVTTPYGADFDGDEMCTHVQRSVETKVEAMELMMVPKNFINPQSGSPIMALKQNSLTGLHILSLRDTFLDFNQIIQMLSFTKHWNGELPLPCIFKPKELWSGKQIFSLLIPKDLSHQNQSNVYVDSSTQIITKIKHLKNDELCSKYKNDFINWIKQIKLENKTIQDIPKEISECFEWKDEQVESIPWLSIEDTYVLIKNGVLLAGHLCKNSVGTKHQSLIHLLFADYGPTRTKEFVEDMQTIVGEFLMNKQISMGPKDMERDKQGYRRLVKSKMVDCENKLLEWKNQNMPRKEYEQLANSALNAVRADIAATATKKLHAHNGFKNIIETGGKGSPTNLVWIFLIIGQVNVSGKRIGFQLFERVSSYHERGDISAKAGGFIDNCFRDGLNPKDYIISAIAGREGMADTAVKTSDTGYFQRKLCKSLEDGNVKYDGSVRNILNQVLQFQSGEDGFDITFNEKQKIPWREMDEKTFQSQYSWISTKYENHPMIKRELKRLQKDKSAHWVKPFVFAPCNIARWIERITSIKEKNWIPDLTPKQIINDTYNLQKALYARSPHFTETWDSKLAILIRSYLSSKRILCHYKMNKKEWKNLCEIIFDKVQKALAQPGESVGVVSAQSLGESITQLTLNTFHQAGNSEKNITLGVPRIKEISGYSKKTKMPSMTIYLIPEVSNENMVKFIARNIIHITLVDIINDIHYEKKKYEPFWYFQDFSQKYPEKDEMNTTNYVEFSKLLFDYIPDILPNKEIHYSDHICTILLDQNRLLEKRISVQKIAKNIQQKYGNALLIKYTDEYSPAPFLEIRLSVEYGTTQESLRELIQNLIENTHISGIPSIKNSFISNNNGEWIVETEGSNIKGIFSIPFVDRKRTTTNVIPEIFENFGIEAARNSIIREIDFVLSKFGCFVDQRHLCLLSDLMCLYGKVMAITRHGINRMDTGPLVKASFEETKYVLQDAARFAERDPMQGATAAIMVGSIPRMGTGSMDVIIDEEFLKGGKPIPFYPTEEYNNLLKQITQENKSEIVKSHNSKQSDFFMNFSDDFD